MPQSDMAQQMTETQVWYCVSDRCRSSVIPASLAAAMLLRSRKFRIKVIINVGMMMMSILNVALLPVFLYSAAERDLRISGMGCSTPSFRFWDTSSLIDSWAMEPAFSTSIRYMYSPPLDFAKTRSCHLVWTSSRPIPRP
ncbi:nicotinamide mononucleotide permease [Colletotrichum asianum]